MVSTFSRVWINRVWWSILFVVPCHRSPPRICSRETGSAVLFFFSKLRLNPALTHGIPLSATASTFMYRQSPSGPARIYRVTQLLADVVHCRESTGAGPAVLKAVPVTVVQVTGAVFSGITVDQLFMCLYFPTAATIGMYLVAMLLLLLLFLTFSVLVANPKKLLYTVANPARGLLNREKRTKVGGSRNKEVLSLQPVIPPNLFGLSPPDWGMLRRSRCVQMFL